MRLAQTCSKGWRNDSLESVKTDMFIMIMIKKKERERERREVVIVVVVVVVVVANREDVR